MAVIPIGTGEKSAPPERVRRRPAIRVPSPLAPSRTLLVICLAIGAAEGPEAWLRAILAAGALIVAYLAGTKDGRREFSLEALRYRRDDGAAGQPPRGEPGEGPA